MLINLILTILPIISATASYLHHKDTLYPPFINALLWLVILILNFSGAIEIHKISTYGLILINLGVFSFLAGSFIVTNNKKIMIQKIYLIEQKSQKANIIFLLIGLIGLYFVYEKMSLFGNTGPSENFFFNIRYSLSNEEDLQTYGIYAYFSGFAYIGLLFNLIFKSKNHDLYFYMFLALAIGYAISSAGRTSLLLVILSIMGSLLITRRLAPRKGLYYFVVSFIPVFFMVSILVGKSGADDLSIIQKIYNSYDSLLQYLLGGSAAFDIWIQKQDNFEYGLNSFRTIIAIFKTLGFDVYVPNLIKEYETVPFLTNIYTVHKPYYADFGFIGIIISQIIFGIAHGKTYHLATKYGRTYVIFYALLLYPLFMQFFQDQYFSLLSTWVQFMIISFLYLIIHKIR